MPVVVHPHGGPTAAHVEDWDGRLQYFLDKGYAWLQVNFRGSTGYGRDFERRNHGVWGVEDTWDCLAAADWLRQQDWADGDRLAIAGGSYGSYMALLASPTTRSTASAAPSRGTATATSSRRGRRATAAACRTSSG